MNEQIDQQLDAKGQSTGRSTLNRHGTGLQDTPFTASYDSLRRRIQSSITQGTQTRTFQYLYEGQQHLGEIRDGKISHRLLTGLSLDEAITRLGITPSGGKDAAASRLYLTDALNSVIAQLNDDSQGTLANSYAYRPFGEGQVIGVDSTANPVQYTSRENDGMGLMYYRARYYDPVIKRFVSTDPVGLRGGWNTFAYVEGNPLSLADPNGLNPLAGAFNGGRLGAAGGSAFGPVGIVVGGIGGALVGAGIG